MRYSSVYLTRVRDTIKGVSLQRLVMVVALSVAMVGAVTQSAGAAVPVAPFPQCPAIGADTSCALLIYIDPSGTPSVAGDPTQGPFDGIEDTLIGVQNDSSSPVSSLPVSSQTGKALFSFDGDGLCQFGTVSGCPFDSTGYAGPGVSFTVSGPSDGLVTFNPPLAPGAHTYFSLEEALSTVPPFDISPTPGLATQLVGEGAAEPVVAVNPTNANNIVVAFNHATRNAVTGTQSLHCSYVTSSDGGLHWSGMNDLALPNAPHVSGAGDPSLAFMPNGTLFFGCMANADDDGTGVASQVYAAIGSDSSKGLTFGPSSILVHGSRGAASPDQEYLAADPNGGSVYMCYTFFAGDGTGVRVAKLGINAPPGGPLPYIVNRSSASAGTHQQTPQGCTLSVAPSGRVWAAWWDGAPYGSKNQPDPSVNQAFAAYSDNGAASFTNVTSLGAKRGSDTNTGKVFHPGKRVYIQASPSGDGRVIAVWEDNPAGADNIQQTVNSGGGWGAASTVQSAATQPSLAWGTDGKVIYGFYANSGINGSGLLYQLARTTGPATSVLSPQQAPASPSTELTFLSPFCGSFACRFGDYNGVAEDSNGTTFSVWTDNSVDSGHAETVWVAHN